MQYGRWVSYIYRYRDNVRCENAGFVKVQRVAGNADSLARIQIGLRLYKENACVCDVYLLFQGKKITKLTDISIKSRERDVVVRRVQFPWENILGEGYNLDDYDGIVIFCSDGEMLAGMWKDYEPDFVGVGKEEQEAEEKLLEQEAEQEEFLKCVAVTEEKEEQEYDQLQEIIDTYPRLPLFMDSPFVECVKIVPQDIGRLNPRNWKLGSNSFLNHSYHRYKYLMIGRVKLHDGQKLVLGVPGVYTNKEKYVANMFGFCRFVPLKKTNTMTGKFGYWIWEILRE